MTCARPMGAPQTHGPAVVDTSVDFGMTWVFCFVQKMSERRAHSCKISYSASAPTGTKSLVCSVILLTCDGDIILLYFVPKHFLCSFSACPLDVRLL